MLKNTGRLQFEKSIMAKELPQFWFYQMGDVTYFQGWHRDSSRGLLCQLKLDLSPWYPDQMPSLYITSPQSLWKYDGGSINLEGVSHAYHTLENGPNGCVQICHFKEANWDASRSCMGVLLKGILWCEAYGAHLLNGLSIAEILEQWKGR